MHWMRIDRYYASAKPFNQDRPDDGHQYPENPEMVHEPMMCQHCENAPCETVCPVNATVHSEDGLNVMAYNRCIGTRYCANNCPFKVRRFNFFDYNQRPVGKKKLAGEFSIYEEYLGPLTKKGAPDMREAAEESERHRAHARRDGEMHLLRAAHRGGEDRRACARRRFGPTRSSRGIRSPAPARRLARPRPLFSAISPIPESRVSKMKAQDRNYRLLEYLNVNTRTSYLARIRNPNPKMPDAEQIAVASLADKAEGITRTATRSRTARQGRGQAGGTSVMRTGRKQTGLAGSVRLNPT